jgi:hypothetical protein
MSDHFTEDLVCASIRALDRSTRSALEIRDGIYRLYRYQDGGDCSWTEGRLLYTVLLPRAYTYELPSKEHPLYSSAFDTAPIDDVTFVRRLLGMSDDESQNDVETDLTTDQGYLIGDKLYCNIGTSLWRSLTQNGTLPSTPEPRTLSLAEVVSWFAESVVESDPQLVADWFARPVFRLFQDFEPDASKLTRERLESIPFARTLRECGLKAKAAVTRDDDEASASDMDVPLADGGAWKEFAEELAERQRDFLSTPAGRIAAERDAWWRGEA